MKLPSSLLKGEALREAAATDLQDIMRLVRTACAHYYSPADPERIYILIEGVSATHVIVMRNERYYRHSYTLDANNVVILGTAEEVNKEFTPVSTILTEAANTLAGGFSSFIEAKDDSGKIWEIRVIDAGLSKNKVLYPAALLREAAPMFDGARVFVKSDVEHIKGEGKDFGKLIGRLSNPRFIEASTDKAAGINADFSVLQSAGDTAAKLKEAFDRGMSDVFGFSIDADGKWKDKKTFREASSITKVNSVDLIIEPGAGGQIIRLVEAKQEVDTMRDRMIEAVKAANNGQLPAGLDVDNDAALEAAYREALAPKPDNAAVEAAALRESKATARAVIAESTLPAAAREKLKAQFDAQTVRFTEAEVATAIANEAAYLAKFTESGKVKAGEFNDVRVTEDRADRVAQKLDAFFDKSDRSVQSFKECYIDITGDSRVTGQIRDADKTRLREAFGDFREALDSTSWAEVLGDSITRRMKKDYNSSDENNEWKNLADIVPLSDFRVQERTIYGEYEDLPDVNESADYQPLTSPSDEKSTYKASKKGGIESVTLEMIKNDDVGAIRNIPIKLVRAAKRTLNKRVLNNLRDNPVFNGKTLFHADRLNLGSAALDEDSFDAARLAIMEQRGFGSSEPLGIPPKILWVPLRLHRKAYDMFKRDTNNDPNFVQSYPVKIITVGYWMDQSDWYLTADPYDIPTIEVGFLDGKEEPEVFTQDAPTVGSLFNNDAIKYKIRHIYGVGVMDYRGMYKAVVA